MPAVRSIETVMKLALRLECVKFVSSDCRSLLIGFDTSTVSQIKSFCLRSVRLLSLFML